MTSTSTNRPQAIDMKNPNGWFFAFFVFFLVNLGGCNNANAQRVGFYDHPQPYAGWTEQSLRDRILKVAKGELGVRERSGKNDGFHVEKYLLTTGLGGGFAWCAAFVNWSYLQAGVIVPSDKAAWSPSWFPPDRTYWQVGVVEYRKPIPGDVFGIYFSGKKRVAHVGIIEKWEGKYATTIEGNTNDAGSREGDGVYRKRRWKKQVSRVSSWINE